MQLVSLEGTFGVLDGAKIEFSPEFSFFYLPNEAGKSTWTAFLRVMLYGLSTSARDSKSALADKNRYQPHSGQPMEGLLRVRRDDGRIVAIHRYTTRSGPLQGFSAVYEDSGLPCPELTAQTCGRQLTGLGQGAFLSCALVQGGELTPGCDEELEQKMAALAATGDTTAAYSRAREELERRRRGLRLNARTGKEPELLQRQAQLTNRLEQLQQGKAQLTQWEQQLRELEKEKEQLRNDPALSAAGPDAGLLAARLECQRLEEETRRLAGGLPEEELLTRLEEQVQALEESQGALQREQEMQQESERQFSRRLEQLFEKEEQYRQALRERGRYHVRYGALAGAAVCSLLAVISFFFPLDVPYLAPYEPAAFFALFLVLLAVAASGLRGRPPEPAPFDWEGEKARLSQARTRAGQPLQQARAEVERRQSELLTLAAALGRPMEDVGDVRRALAAARERQRQLGETNRALTAARRQLAQREQAQRAGEERAAPRRRRLTQLEGEIVQLRQERDRMEGSLRTLGSEEELRLQLEETSEALASVRQEREALTLALQWLEEGNERLRARLSPAINRRAAEYLRAFTGGAYDRVRIGRGLEAAAIPAGAIAQRDRLRLSDGTRGQLYLALRLAVLDVVLPPRPAVPVILDDALLTFDEERMAAALAVLRQVGQRRQVILFSCRKEGAR